MEWIPIVLVTFKLIVLGTGMFFAVKWHYDQGTKEADKKMERRAVLRAASKVAVIFVVSLLSLGLFAFFLVTKIGLNLNWP
jgi:heme/copper-type cytochrome/quinol oxidase subunit 2